MSIKENDIIQFVVQWGALYNYKYADVVINRLIHFLSRQSCVTLLTLLDNIYDANDDYRIDISRDIKNIIITELEQYGIFNLRTLECNIEFLGYFLSDTRILVDVYLNGDARALNLLKLKNPKLYNTLKLPVFLDI